MDLPGINHNYGVPLKGAFPLDELFPDYPIPGIVIDMENFNSDLPFYSIEGIFAHETAHFLGLDHTFSAGLFVGDCDIENDYMEDTPRCNQTTLCDISLNQNTCIEELNDEPDNVANVMNYGCMIMFTPDQVMAMHNNLLQANSELYSDTSCGTISSIKEAKNLFNSTFDIFPNPNEGIFTIQLQNVILDDAIFTIYNTVGHKLVQQNINSYQTEEILIKKTSLPQGIYYANLRNKETNLTKIFIVK